MITNLWKQIDLSGFLCKIGGGGDKFELKYHFSTVNLEYIYFWIVIFKLSTINASS